MGARVKSAASCPQLLCEVANPAILGAMETTTSPVVTDLFEAAAPATPRLFLVFSPERQVVVEEPPALSGGTTLIGREAGAGARIVLAGDRGVSRQHAVLEHEPRTRAVTLRDTSSQHSTWVNGHRPPPGEALPLTHGDIIRVGDSVLVLSQASPVAEAPTIPGMLGRSPLLMQLRAQLGKLASSQLPVLLLGESGTGKECAAQGLHFLSKRPKIFAQDCGALVGTLAESTLFGHVKGAATHVSRDRKGLFREADGGTLFLDEVGNLPEELQRKFLRVLSERRVYPVGAEEMGGYPVDVLLIAATNQPLQRDAQAGSFRLDLFRRIAGVVLTVPSLRARREDILYLMRETPAGKGATGPKLPALHTSQVELLLLYAWPGNVRELLQLRSEVCVLGFHDELRQRLSAGATSPLSRADADADAKLPRSARPTREPRPDRARLTELLIKHQGRLLPMEAETGWSRRTLRDLVNEYSLKHLRRQED